MDCEYVVWRGRVATPECRRGMLVFMLYINHDWSPLPSIPFLEVGHEANMKLVMVKPLSRYSYSVLRNNTVHFGVLYKCCSAV